MRQLDERERRVRRVATRETALQAQVTALEEYVRELEARVRDVAAEKETVVVTVPDQRVAELEVALQLQGQSFSEREKQFQDTWETAVAEAREVFRQKEEEVEGLKQACLQAAEVREALRQKEGEVEALKQQCLQEVGMAREQGHREAELFRREAVERYDRLLEEMEASEALFEEQMAGCKCFTVPEARAASNPRSPSLDPRQTPEPASPEAPTVLPATPPPQATQDAYTAAAEEAERFLLSLDIRDLSQETSAAEEAESLLQSLAILDYPGS